MSVKKIEFDGKTLIDLTKDTVAAGSMLNGVTAHNNEGDIITGNIPTKTAANLTANGKTVTVPAGYYSTQATKDVASVARANTTMTSTKSTDNKKITITASNNQGTGYVTGANKTASRDVTLSISGKTATASDGNVSISQNVADGAILATNGSISADGTTYTQAKINASAGYITAGEKIGGATFANTATQGKTYKNISGTTAAPILVSGSSLFINKGYTDDVEISLARLVPNGASPVQSIKNGMLTSVSAYDSDGTLVTGNIISRGEADVTVSEAVLTVPAGYYATNITKDVAGAGTAKAPTSITGSSATLTAGTNTITLKKTVSVTPVVTPGYITTGTATNSAVSLTASVTTKGAATYNTATSDQTIAAGQYLTGAQTIKAVTTSNIVAGNILKGVVVKVGDANDAGRIKNITGTADYVKTVSSVPTAKDTSIIYNSANGKYYIWK